MQTHLRELSMNSRRADASGLSGVDYGLGVNALLDQVLSQIGARNLPP